MSILETIENRTENWKTARSFAPLVRDGGVRLAEKLLANHRGNQQAQAEFNPSDVRIELFWYGMRDYLYHNAPKKKGYYKAAKELHQKTFADEYERLFSCLRQKVTGSGLFNELKPDNYDVCTDDRVDELFDNLFHTEVDIVLESPKHLFIGEAKHESKFGAVADWVLVHQLIREYVMARLLVEHLDSKKEVVPFVVGDDVGKLKRYSQVQFMLKQCWLKEENVLSWDCVANLARNS